MSFSWSFHEKQEQNFSKGHKIPSHHRTMKCGFQEFLHVFRERHQNTWAFFPWPFSVRRYPRLTSLGHPSETVVYFFVSKLKGKKNKSTRVFFLFCFVSVCVRVCVCMHVLACKSEFSLVKSAPIWGSEMLKIPLPCSGSLFLFFF